jgi:hypothetical protein
VNVSYRCHDDNLNIETQSIKRDSADVNRLAVVAAVILAGLWHAENFTQRRADAKQNYSLKVASAGGNRSRQ